MNGELTERQAFLVLNALPNIGPITLHRLLAALGDDPREVLKASTRTLESVQGVGPAISSVLVNWDKHFDLSREESWIERVGGSFLIQSDAEYSSLLKEISDPPIGLYRKGNYDFSKPCVAIVGSRKTTAYGLKVAEHFAAELARIGFCIVSGMARGIDTAAHRGALSAGGSTVAVMGCGLDTIYPPENLDLYRQIVETGAVISEFPFGRRPDRQTFPMRNRLISGLSEAIVVVESGVSGGSMITARFGSEQGRIVGAIPGRIDQETSRGCNELIRDGVTLLTSVDDLLAELEYLHGKLRLPTLPTASAAAGNAPPERGGPEIEGRAEPSSTDAVNVYGRAPDLSPDEARVLACFSGGEILRPDEIAAQTGLSAGQVSPLLMMLEIKRCLVRRLDGAFEPSPGALR
ncbi:DNA processing protein DprA [Cephaloticoccus primus]|uniref:DNA processing protein DprA n=1 Tax=Cephaloticoccus primus TaxID=1548207 RepID=A0A139SIX3_9BACT|nr:DNA-processing protein DprA [Cephaloticoccus primus]KXU34499.1 DNA processing protein DprA [Cephaloticoccus primus]